jgi:predicted RNA binding protein YcfA (HicA-like mRNA interferase family)
MTARLAALTAREVQRALLRLGFELVRQKGSHQHYYRHRDRRAVTLPWHSGDLAVGTIRAIARAAGVSPSEFVEAARPGRPRAA